MRRGRIVLLLLFLFLGTTPATAQDTVTEDLQIRPAAGSSTDPAGSYFVLDSRAGRTVRQKVQITNGSQEPVELRLSTVDAVTAAKGGVAFELPDQPVDDEGAWIQVKADRVELAPGRTREVPFEVEIPAETEPGVHLGGIAIALVDDSQPEASPTTGGAVIDVQSRFVIAVQVDLPGDAAPELVISGVEPVVTTGGVTLEVLIENVGFGLTEGDGVLELPEEGFEEPLPLGKFVPGTAIRYPVPWEESPAEGEYAARVEINYSEGDPELLTGTATWEGTFLIGQAQTGELNRLQGDEGFNLWLAVIPALSLAVVVAFLLWRRNRREPPAAATPVAAPRPQTPQGGGYTGSTGGTYGGPSQAPPRAAQPASQQKAPVGAPPPPPPPPKQGP